MRKLNITIGADPELFIVNEKTNKVISSIGLIPGEKGNAYLPKGFKRGFGVQIDNILAEFNIPPVKNKKDFVAHNMAMKQYINDFVKNVNPDYGVQCVASRMVDDDQLQDPIAKMFGCCPDYNAYTESQNEAPEGDATNLRSTGFHIHIGYNNPNVIDSVNLVKWMDTIVGVASVLLDPDTERRKLYGKAGCFRLTNYGVEYRVLSGYFLGSEELLETIYDLTMKAISFYFSGFENYNSDEVVDCINNLNKEKAVKILEKFEIKINQ